MHHKNRHKSGYKFSELKKANTDLSHFIIKNTYNHQDTIDFSDPVAVKTLNFSLLKSDYNLKYWLIPDGYLCPPIPGRLDYIHYLADLLASTPKELITNKQNIKVLDVGTGASCIYPILGNKEYNWHFIGSDIDPKSIEVANKNIKNNGLKNIQCRLQSNSDYIFNGVIKENEYFHLTLCNPPFHKSLADATEGTRRKWKNLSKTKTTVSSNQKSTLNFGGQKAELWCPGGELSFIKKMIKESKNFQKQVLWFTCLVSKKEHLSKLKLYLKKANVMEIKIISMAQGSKTSRFIAWRFI